MVGAGYPSWRSASASCASTASVDVAVDVVGPDAVDDSVSFQNRVDLRIHPR